MGHMTVQRFIPIAAVFALAACGQGAGSGDSGSGDVGSPPGGGTTDSVLYQGALTVLQDAEGEVPELCGVVAESYPPQCAGLPVSGWDWDSVEHEEASGVRWGSFLVTGSFDGESLVLTEEPVPTAEIDMADYPDLQYTEPEIGEPAEDLSVEELQAIADELVAEFPVYVVGGWADEQNGVALVDALLVTPELEAYVQERFPEGTVAFSQMLKPVE